MTEVNSQDPIRDSYGINIIRNSSALLNSRSRSKSNKKGISAKQNEKIKKLVKCVALSKGTTFEHRNINFSENNMASTYGLRVNPSQKPILSPEKLKQMSIENLNSD